MIAVRKAEDRGHADIGWLNTHYTFSFANYYDPQWNGYRSLRVLNDDTIAPGRGFGAHGHRDMLAHGLQVAIQGAAGAGIFPHVIGDALVGFLEQSSRFLKPVYCGDTLYPMLEVSDLKPGRTTGVVSMKLTIHNQSGELVCDGEHKYLVKKRP